MCVHRSEDGRCLLYTDGTHTSYCIPGDPCDDEEPSVADKIRIMSDRELAVFLCDLVHEEDVRLQRAMVELGYPLTLISVPQMFCDLMLKNIRMSYREFREKYRGGNQT